MDLIEGSFVKISKLVGLSLVNNLIGKCFVRNAKLVPDTDVLGLEHRELNALVHTSLQVLIIPHAIIAPYRLEVCVLKLVLKLRLLQLAVVDRLARLLHSLQLFFLKLANVNVVYVVRDLLRFNAFTTKGGLVVALEISVIIDALGVFLHRHAIERWRGWLEVRCAIVLPVEVHLLFLISHSNTK